MVQQTWTSWLLWELQLLMFILSVLFCLVLLLDFGLQHTLKQVSELFIIYAGAGVIGRLVIKHVIQWSTKCSLSGFLPVVGMQSHSANWDIGQGCKGESRRSSRSQMVENGKRVLLLCSKTK